jgi:hypothetical protein
MKNKLPNLTNFYFATDQPFKAHLDGNHAKNLILEGAEIFHTIERTGKGVTPRNCAIYADFHLQ